MIESGGIQPQDLKVIIPEMISKLKFLPKFKDCMFFVAKSTYTVRKFKD